MYIYFKLFFDSKHKKFAGEDWKDWKIEDFFSQNDNTSYIIK